MRIGIFDSGLGGLGVTKEILRLMPGIEIFYISDSAYCPYGEKTQAQVTERCRLLTQTLLSQGEITLIVVACNTATALSIDELRGQFPVPFIGVEPYLNFINKHPAPEKLRPVVLLTPASAQSARFRALQEKLNLQVRPSVHPCEGLADLIETQIHHKETPSFLAQLETILGPLKGKGFTHAILGCTHYPFISREIEKLLGVECVAPEAQVAQRTLELLKKAPPPFSPSASSPSPSPTLNLNFKKISENLHFATTKDDPDLPLKLPYILDQLP